MIEARDVRVGGAVRGVSMVVPTGGCMGVIGINGAGKSTLLATLAGVLRADGGVVVGTDGAIYLPEGCPLDRGISVRRWYRLARSLPGWEPEVGEAMIREFGLPEKNASNRLSQGQRVRLGLILALGRRGKVYVLDDPFLGLDPVAAAAAERWIAHRAAGSTMVCAGQDADALERLCTHLTLLNEGTVMASASVEDWRQRYRAVRVMNRPQGVLEALGGAVLQRRDRGQSCELILDDPEGTAERVLVTSGARVDPLPVRFDELLTAMVTA